MRSAASMSVLLQVALLAAFAVVASQIVVFAVVLTAPPPQPAGFSIAAAGDALSGAEARTADGRTLRRRLTDQPQVPAGPAGPLETAIGLTLAQRLDRPVEAVRVRLAANGPRAAIRAVMGPGGPGPALRRGDPTDRRQTMIFTPEAAVPGRAPASRDMPDTQALAGALSGAMRREAEMEGRPPPPSEVTVQLFGAPDLQPRFTVQADRLTFAPFAASVQMADGRWATVEPPRGLLDPWQARLLTALGLTALLLAPVVWVMARRLTRPIRAFAEAAERLGADPEAAPLTPSGPSEVRTAIAAFNDMQAAIRAHMRQRTQTIAAIAHDLRTPLTRLRFRAEQSPEALRDKMTADVEEMDALIAQAMAFVRGEAQAERQERLDLSALAQHCAAGFAETGADVRFEGDGPLPVLGDPASLRRALGNLIDNAVKFGGAARVSATRTGDLAVVTISDDGPGLPDEELEAAFEPFHRGERSRSRQTGGAGLGLAVARQAARAAGGDVALANRSDGGLMASLALPLAG